MRSKTLFALCLAAAVWLALVAGCSGLAQDGGAQMAGPQADRYRLSLAVDEVALTFHAADAHGLPVNDLKAGDITLFDDGQPPRRIVAFRLMQDFPIRAGILMDTSASMSPHLGRARGIATLYAERLLRQQTDQAFVMDFGSASSIRQPWTNDAASLAASIGRVAAGKQNLLGGTALFDTVFRACFNLIGPTDHAASGNFVLVFTDGEDNASHVSLQEAVDQCQKSNTAIYAFGAREGSGPGPVSTGPKTLAELATQTGGRVFSDADSASSIEEDLRTIEANLRNQYRLIYNPAQLRHDGRFHRIALLGPDRVSSIEVRSGYYAPQPAQ